MAKRDIMSVDIELLDRMVSGLAKNVIPDLTPEEAERVDDVWAFLEQVDAEGLGFEVAL